MSSDSRYPHGAHVEPPPGSVRYGAMSSPSPTARGFRHCSRHDNTALYQSAAHVDNNQNCNAANRSSAGDIRVGARPCAVHGNRRT